MRGYPFLMACEVCRGIKANFRFDRKAYKKARHQKAMTRRMLRESHAREYIAEYIREQLGIAVDQTVREAVSSDDQR